MRIGFQTSTNYVPEFHGNANLAGNEQLTAVLRTMTLGDFLEVAEGLSEVQDGKVDTTKMSIKDNAKILALATKFLPKYVEIKNLSDANGAEIDINTAANFALFAPLLAELLIKLVQVSSPSETDVKN